MSSEENQSGFISHLTELRKRLIHSFVFLLIFFVICYLFAEYIYGFLVDPFAQAVKDDGGPPHRRPRLSELSANHNLGICI